MNQERIEYLKAAIADISKRLKGPMSNFERALLVVAFADYREELAKLKASE